MGLVSFLFRSLNTSEQKMFDEAVAPPQDTTTATGRIKTVGIVNDVSPAYLNTEAKLGANKVLTAIWGGAYHVHQWFIENVQHGEDDGGYYEVTYEYLETLLEVLEAVSKDNAKELLPTFLEYDEDYWEQTQYTKELVKYLLDNFNWDECSLIYSAWW